MIPGGMSDLVIPEFDPPPPFRATCPECDRVFNLLDEDDAAELAYGHDCEPPLFASPRKTLLDVRQQIREEME